MLSKKKVEFILESPFFSSVTKESLDNYRREENIFEKKFKKNEIVFSSESVIDGIGIIESGNALVYGACNDTILDILRPKDIFGAQPLFLGIEHFKNRIVAEKNLTVIFIERSVITDLIETNATFAVDYIKYLSRRIRYLDERIDDFTGSSAEARLARYLLKCFENADSFELDVSFTFFSSMLGIGRASLYRAFDTLCDSGAITKTDKTIRLTDEEKLNSFLKG